MIQHFSALNKSLMLGFDHVFASGEVLGEHFAIVLIILTFLGLIWILDPDNLRLLFIIHLI